VAGEGLSVGDTIADAREGLTRFYGADEGTGFRVSPFALERR
jgi:hypothetical protein